MYICFLSLNWESTICHIHFLGIYIILLTFLLSNSLVQTDPDIFFTRYVYGILDYIFTVLWLCTLLWTYLQIVNQNYTYYTAQHCLLIGKSSSSPRLIEFCTNLDSRTVFPYGPTTLQLCVEKEPYVSNLYMHIHTVFCIWYSSRMID